MRIGKKTSALFTFCVVSLFIASQLFAQKDIKNPNISYVRNEYNEISKIEFIVGKNGIKKSFDVYENNPYNKLSYQKDNQKTLMNIVYKVNSISMSALLPGFKPDYYRNKKNGEIKIDGLVSNSFIKYSEDKRSQIVVYQLSATVNNDIMGSVSTFIIIDSTGTVIKKLENIETNINKIGITNDGKYLFISYGFDNVNGTIIEHGVKIYDLLKNKIVVEKKHSFYGGFVTNNLIVIGYEFYSNNELFSLVEVFDFYNSKKYTRTFKDDELGIIEITKNGYLINYKNNLKQLSFKNDFLNENL